MLIVPTVTGWSTMTVPPAPDVKLTNWAGAFGATPPDHFDPSDQPSPVAPVQVLPAGGVTCDHAVSTRSSSTSMPLAIAVLPWRSSRLTIAATSVPTCVKSAGGGVAAPKLVEPGLIQTELASLPALPSTKV